MVMMGGMLNGHCLERGSESGCRRKFVECVNRIKKHPASLKPELGGPITPADAVLLSVGPKPPVALQDNCDYR